MTGKQRSRFVELFETFLSIRVFIERSYEKDIEKKRAATRFEEISTLAAIAGYQAGQTGPRGGEHPGCWPANRIASALASARSDAERARQPIRRRLDAAGLNAAPGTLGPCTPGKKANEGFWRPIGLRILPSSSLTLFLREREDLSRTADAKAQ